MTIEVVPIALPTSADNSRLKEFGREVKGVNPGTLTNEEFADIEEQLYKHDILLFRNVDLTPAQQYALTKAFDPTCENYGHGNNKTSKTKQSILHYLKTIPTVPQVQLIGNGTLYDHEGIAEAELKHPSHKTFHKTSVSSEDEGRGYTRFNRWHIDAALYDLAPPKVTTLYGLKVPSGPDQICRYDDGSNDELAVPLGATAFASGRIMFDILPPELKSVAVRSRVKYSPHPYVWMSTARALSTGLGIENDGLEMPLVKLPPWEEDKIKIYPMLWKNPVNGNLHFQVHPCAAVEIFVDALPEGVHRDGALYPEGAHITNLGDVRSLLTTMQRPGIAPSFVYPHDWKEKDLIVFHNRGVIHSVTGALKPEQLRVYHQCNLAASDEPNVPSGEDVAKWA